MNSKINLLLNMKPAEAKIVKQLFLVQFFLGIGTSFLFTSTLAMFLHSFEVKALPNVYMASAGLLMVANFFYAKVEARLSAKKLLKTIILFSACSILLTWAGVSFLAEHWVPFALSALYMVVYMVVGYAFWGMSAIIFNVRESKRLFSVVGSGDIPAKLIGYSAVSVLAPLLGVENLLWFSVAAFGLAYFFLEKFQHQAIISHTHDHGHAHDAHSHGHDDHSPAGSFFARYFQNHLIFSIAVFSLIAFTVYSLIDYTLLAEVKSRFINRPDLATFIGVFFALGRILALLVKLAFSSRVISRLGLTNVLLITPLVLLLMCGILLLPGESERTILYIFGVMVLFSEVLKSAVQEPAFFVLFQPLDPHSRLRGHLISKGYTMPFALLATGVFLTVYKHFNGSISILTVCQILILLLVVWIASVFLIKKEYVRTLVGALKKGYFTGSELFLNDDAVRTLLLAKLESGKAKEVILALELLERSNYQDLEKRMLPLLSSPSATIRRYVLSRVMELRLTDAFPIIEQELQRNASEKTRADFVSAYFLLSPQLQDIPQTETLEVKKAALIGLALRGEEKADELVSNHLQTFAQSTSKEDKLMALEIISKTTTANSAPLLQSLLQDETPAIYKKAIETAGLISEVSLVPQILQVAQTRNTPFVLQKALVHYGDHLFESEYLASQLIPDNLLLPIIKGTGKVKGEASTQFLVQLLGEDKPYQDDIIEALWSKNASLPAGGEQAIETWLTAKLRQSRQKSVYCMYLMQQQELPLLVTSLVSEIKQDIKKAIKSLALLSDRQQINRILDLLTTDSAEKTANSIEMMEQLISKKYFLPLELLLDFQLDKEKSLVAAAADFKGLDTKAIIRDIVSENKAYCSSWTRSVACYSILQVPGTDLVETIAPTYTLGSDLLFSETQEYVFSQLTKSEKCY